MKPFILCLSAALPLLAGCAATNTLSTASDAGLCARATSPFCAFVNAPLRLASDVVQLPRRPYPFRPLAQDLTFVDRQQRVWVAPQGILTDGASIPPAFVAVVGQPTDPAFAMAAAIHDSYCGVGNEGTPYFHTRPWRDTHRMFYEALRVGGTAEKRAKTMFAAVYMGGPRWLLVRPHPEVTGQGRRETLSSRNVRGGIDRPELWHVPEAELQAKLRAIVAEIEAGDPSISGIEGMVEEAVADLLSQYPAGAVGDVSGPDPDDSYRGGDDSTSGSSVGSLSVSVSASMGLNR
ncbi:DUF1353 domain-containing protein [Pseudooceanicola sp.]|uniref:DUF1353 domain-containing protein n=1 Tax=Pseudooceanicola sp. TaxID=1914328 RepID=UPI0035C7689F